MAITESANSETNLRVSFAQDITPRVTDLIYSARCPMLFNISMKFHEDMLNGFKVIERHDFVTETATYKVQRDISKKNMYPRVTDLILCTSSNVG